jgi:hypothetical protein
MQHFRRAEVSVVVDERKAYFGKKHKSNDRRTKKVERRGKCTVGVGGGEGGEGSTYCRGFVTKWSLS